jgi:hypothetical protein
MGEKMLLNKHEKRMLGDAGARIAMNQAAARIALLQTHVAMLAFAVHEARTPGADPDGGSITVPEPPAAYHTYDLDVAANPDRSVTITFTKPAPKLALPVSGLVGPDGAPAGGAN